ncbi:MAG: T9SS type A sorting domain-containing protein [Nonlabens sp.]
MPLSQSDAAPASSPRLVPNPSSGNVAVTGAALGDRYGIYGTAGRLVRGGVLPPSLNLDLTHLKTGIYLVSITDPEGRTSVLKLLKE